jgi:hypothetical protein
MAQVGELTLLHIGSFTCSDCLSQITLSHEGQNPPLLSALVKHSRQFKQREK